jgi:hypothetical protein
MLMVLPAVVFQSLRKHEQNFKHGTRKAEENVKQKADDFNE